MAGVYDWLQNQPVDPKVPAWDGTGEAIGLESYVCVANAYELTLEQDKRLLAGPRLWQNLRGEALRAVETMNVAELRVPDGVGVLMRALAARYPETPLKKLPRLYRALFREIRYQRRTDAGDIFTKFERARAELQPVNNSDWRSLSIVLSTKRGAARGRHVSEKSAETIFVNMF